MIKIMIDDHEHEYINYYSKKFHTATFKLLCNFQICVTCWYLTPKHLSNVRRNFVVVVEVAIVVTVHPLYFLNRSIGRSPWRSALEMQRHQPRCLVPSTATTSTRRQDLERSWRRVPIKAHRPVSKTRKPCSR